MKKQVKDFDSDQNNFSELPKIVNIQRLGIVSHDYRCKEKNNYRDFSDTFVPILSFLDNKNCDSVLFSLFTIIQREDFDIIQILNNFNNLTNIKAVFIEEYHEDGNERTAGDYVIYSKEINKWKEYRITQKFGTLQYTKKFRNTIIEPFKEEIKSQRLLGNFTVLLCGETNIVKYSKESKKINDEFKFVNILPPKTEVILNPIHDRMTRFEIKLKRKFLSEHNRWVVSVWNKGKADKNGKIRDGKKPAWAVYHNGKEKDIESIEHKIPNKTNIEIGLLVLSNE